MTDLILPAQPLTDPVTDPITDPITDHMTDPMTDPIIDPMTGPKIVTGASCNRSDAPCTEPSLKRPAQGRCRPASTPNRPRLARHLLSGLVAAALWTHATPGHCEWVAPGDQLRVTFGPKVIHFNPSPEHAAHNNLVSVEWLTRRWTFWGADRSMIGFAAFANSFGQFSQYLSFGQEWDLWKVWGGEVFGNVSVGLIHGYKEPYADKIPFNQLGIAPGILPTLGWRRGHFSVSATLLGFNGLLIGAAWSFDLR